MFAKLPFKVDLRSPCPTTGNILVDPDGGDVVIWQRALREAVPADHSPVVGEIEVQVVEAVSPTGLGQVRGVDRNHVQREVVLLAGQHPVAWTDVQLTDYVAGQLDAGLRTGTAPSRGIAIDWDGERTPLRLAPGAPPRAGGDASTGDQIGDDSHLAATLLRDTVLRLGTTATPVPSDLCARLCTAEIDRLRGMAVYEAAAALAIAAGAPMTAEAAPLEMKGSADPILIVHHERATLPVTVNNPRGGFEGSLEVGLDLCPRRDGWIVYLLVRCGCGPRADPGAAWIPAKGEGAARPLPVVSPAAHYGPPGADPGARWRVP